MDVKIKIPAINTAFYNSTSFASIKKQIKTIKDNYGVFIKHSAKISNVPEELITAIIFIESAGNPNAISKANAIGLMQIGTNSPTDILFLEKNLGRLNDDEKKLLENHIGKSRLNDILSMAYMGQKSVITKNDLLNPELNILIGTIFLGLLMYRHIEGNTVRLDKVIVGFNKGYFADNQGKDLKGDITNLVKTLNKETSDYIVKLLGKNGVLDAIV